MRSKPQTSSIVHADLEAGLSSASTPTCTATEDQPAKEDQALLTPVSTVQTNFASASQTDTQPVRESNNQTHLALPMASVANSPAPPPQGVQQGSDDIPVEACYTIAALPGMMAIFFLIFAYKGDTGDGITSWILFCLFTNSITWGFTSATVSNCRDPHGKAILPFFGVIPWTLMCGLFAPACIRQELSPQYIAGGNATTSPAF